MLLAPAFGSLDLDGGILCRSNGWGRGSCACRHSCRRHCKQRELRCGEHHGINRAARCARHPSHGSRMRSGRGAGTRRHCAQRRARRRAAAELSLLADRPRGARGFARDCSAPRSHCLSGAGRPYAGRHSAGESPRRAPGDHDLGRRARPGGAGQGPARIALASRYRGGLVPLGAGARAAGLYERLRTRRSRQAPTSSSATVRIIRCRSSSTAAGPSFTVSAICPSTPATADANTRTGSGLWSSLR